MMEPQSNKDNLKFIIYNYKFLLIIRTGLAKLQGGVTGDVLAGRVVVVAFVVVVVLIVVGVV